MLSEGLCDDPRRRFITSICTFLCKYEHLSSGLLGIEALRPHTCSRAVQCTYMDKRVKVYLCSAWFMRSPALISGPLYPLATLERVCVGQQGWAEYALAVAKAMSVIIHWCGLF